ncbi:hypothetical protein RRG08_047850 [Elysia crispata]|uniref:Uncharacterized protein n=1 Tax=Elysia crispata TaxID=231223 RepID=A0AAE0ZX84_9GAST|nr:hypothetical protein RRG08_047850 [Elysia crispata]
MAGYVNAHELTLSYWGDQRSSCRIPLKSIWARATKIETQAYVSSQAKIRLHVASLAGDQKLASLLFSTRCL